MLRCKDWPLRWRSSTYDSPQPPPNGVQNAPDLARAKLGPAGALGRFLGNRELGSPASRHRRDAEPSTRGLELHRNLLHAVDGGHADRFSLASSATGVNVPQTPSPPVHASPMTVFVSGASLFGVLRRRCAPAFSCVHHHLLRAIFIAGALRGRALLLRSLSLR
jgi:hypothetical protein